MHFLFMGEVSCFARGKVNFKKWNFTRVSKPHQGTYMCEHEFDKLHSRLTFCLVLDSSSWVASYSGLCSDRGMSSCDDDYRV